MNHFDCSRCGADIGDEDATERDALCAECIAEELCPRHPRGCRCEDCRACAGDDAYDRWRDRKLDEAADARPPRDA